GDRRLEGRHRLLPGSRPGAFVERGVAGAPVARPPAMSRSGRLGPSFGRASPTGRPPNEVPALARRMAPGRCDVVGASKASGCDSTPLVRTRLRVPNLRRLYSASPGSRLAFMTGEIG